MKSLQKLIVLISFCTQAFAILGGYNTIYLMKFENITSDFSINSFTRAFPDLIIENYAFREDINISFAENNPTYESKIDNGEKSLIVNGRFKTDAERIDVDIELYDLKNWDLLSKKSFYCSKQDFICIHDAFIITIEELISPFLIEQIISNDLIHTPDLIEKHIIVEVTGNEKKTIEKEYIQYLHETDSIAEEFDVVFESDEIVYSKEFNFSSETESNVPLIDQNTERIIHILSQFLSNPYYIEIGDMDVKLNHDNVDLIDINVPVKFSIKRSLIDELLSDIPKQELDNNDGLLMLQFSNKDFRFERELIEKLALMKYQLIPTINFVNKMGELQLLILDSWKRKYSDLIVGGTGVIQRNEFIPLYSIKPGRDNIQISLDLNSKQIMYSFSIRYNTFGDYTKMIVKFMLESELDQYLSVSSRN